MGFPCCPAQELLGLGGVLKGDGKLTFVLEERASSCRLSEDHSSGSSRWNSVLLSTGLVPGSLCVFSQPPHSTASDLSAPPALGQCVF